MTQSTYPLISIVIPVYNRSHIIKRTIDSVISQTYKNIEIIVVDDFSHDSEQLVKKLNKYTDIIYYRHDRNRHGSAARNTGITLSNGEFVAFLDSDDSWDPTKLEECLKVITEEKVDFVYSQVEKIGKQSGIVPTFSIKGNERYSDYLLYRNGSIQTSTLFIRNDVFKTAKFDEELVRFQDYDFLLTLENMKATSFFIEKPLVYMYDDDQLNRISNSININPAITWINKVKEFISKKAYYTFYATRVCDLLVKNKQRKRGLLKLLDPKCFFYCNKKIWFRVLLKCILPNGVGNVIRDIKNKF
ncbi:glycosyltransferase family 2 protein [Vibrio campbellii]|uniref:glycosyltransferase family 2 protein n=1 Tax=Vibrio campbellii TaxID=680 RepID=UPI0005EEA7F5|nr:glycosyltransferase family 2 protein [Vibrio campbellii]